MRNNVDMQFPKKVPYVDISLGGHDHVIMEEMVNGIPVIKSGSNFNNVGLIKIYAKTHKAPHEGTRFNYDWKIHKVTVSQEVDQNLQNYVN
jgi:2',3'-cyclic-nucleotide 2'-phosphodiesterase (5'-nucleotidase family)